ncbi:hypothetical protein SmJEL517_g01217 [Synchytrium microbalum]|uniref:Uncharacterized protein n=1 Tax=Synchytrium microbalum TaxID=1806994 RepID=A0A507CF66_9FUNG|nr:uncharacterized protein SmJEL517_g01217 [Synchytrium microbalum]TPX36564.1 hypothetical protein SmJEL517_g01217 [Synchytrium microbalum]
MPWSVDGCKQDDAAQSAFVEATLFNTKTNTFRVYHPLIIQKGSTPLAPPTPITVDANEVVGLWFGANGNLLILVDSGGSLKQGVCVNGLDGSPFGQFAHCNAIAFWTATNAAIKAGALTIPPLGNDMMGKPCPTTRSFEHVDQDPADNIVTSYITMGGMFAQNIPQNVAKFPTATVLANPGDNRLLDVAVNPAIGCKPFTAIDATDPSGNTQTGSLALNELSAAANQAPPIAYMQPGNPMTLDGKGAYSVPKLNLYRIAVNQAPVDANANLTSMDISYCMNLLNIGAPYVQAYSSLFAAKKSPTAVATNLFTFMVQRYATAWTNTKCPDLIGTGIMPIEAIMDANQVCTGGIFHFATAQCPATPMTINSPTIMNGTAAPPPVAAGGAPAPAAPAPAAATGSTVPILVNAPCNAKIAVQYPSTCPSGPMRLSARQLSSLQESMVQQAVNEFEARLHAIYPVPTNPLTTGLGTAWVVNGCKQDDPAQNAFVEATLFNTKTNAFRVYHPLIIQKGSTPLVPPTPITVDANEVVGIWFGGNGNLVLQVDSGGSLKQGVCVNGLDGSPFGQFSHCNAIAFWTATNAAIKAGALTIPPLGNDMMGKPCPTTRSFEHVDQDPADNIVTSYITMNGMFAQNIPQNVAKFPTATVLANPGDNRLLDVAVNPAIGCKPFTAVDATDPTGATMTGSLALNELSAAANQAPPIALMQPGNPMTLDAKGAYSLAKLNLYRTAVNQPPLDANANLTAVDISYCMNLLNIGAPYVMGYSNLFAAKKSPTAVATNLFTFMVQRYAAAWTNTKCPDLIQTAIMPIEAIMDANQVCTGGIFHFALGGTCPATPMTINSPTIMNGTATTPPAGGGAAATAPATIAGATVPILVNAPCSAKIAVQYPSSCPTGPMRLRARQLSSVQQSLVQKVVDEFEARLHAIYRDL